jgi:hypothetical protein
MPAARRRAMAFMEDSLLFMLPPRRGGLFTSSASPEKRQSRRWRVLL